MCTNISLLNLFVGVLYTLLYIFTQYFHWHIIHTFLPIYFVCCNLEQYHTALKFKQSFFTITSNVLIAYFQPFFLQFDIELFKIIYKNIVLDKLVSSKKFSRKYSLQISSPTKFMRPLRIMRPFYFLNLWKELIKLDFK